MSRRESPPVQRTPKVFVCYRREETSGHAGRLSDRLVERFGRDSVFMDIDAIRPGQDYVAAIGAAVRNIDVMIAIIGPEWLSAVTPGQAGRRIDDPRDYVRLEIAEALRRKKTVIPALVRDATMPEEHELPDDIQALSRRQAVELRDTAWPDDVQKLVDAIQPPTKPKPAIQPSAAEAPPAAETPTPGPSVVTEPPDGHRLRALFIAASAVVVLGVVVGLLLLGGGGGGDDHPSPPPESPAAGTLVADVGGRPQDAVVDADDGSIWVAVIEPDVGPGLVHLDGSTLSPDAPRGFTGLPVQVTAREGVVWVPTEDGTLLRFDPGSSEPTPLDLGGRPERMFATSESLWVLLPNNGAVVRVDFASSEVGDRLGVGDRPTLIGFADARLWIANAGDATVTPIEPPAGVLQPVELPDVAVAMINHGNDALVATADGRLLVLSPSATGGSVEEIARIDEEPPLRLRLLSAGNLVWVWQPGSSFLWGVDRGAQNPLIPHEAPFPLEKLGLFDGSLWGFSRDGAVVRLSATDASLEDDLGSIEGRPALLLKDEEKARLLVITEDGSVYRIAS